MIRLKKIIIMMICSVFIISLFCSSEAALADKFDGSMSGAETESGKSAIVNIIGSVLDVTRTIGVSVAVTILIILACKYIVASAGDRADIKKFAVTYVIGALVLFGGAGIASILKKFVDSTLN